ncbi:MAG: amidohydrolase family protein [Chloroflexi bacterium]|nr:amidohydrolase family protein [Chloroflexota bacterium]
MYLGFLPLQKLLDRGINVCLGADAAAAANSLDLFKQMHTAALIHKGHHEDMGQVPAEAVLDMATSGGARALGLDTGAISVGRKADLIVIDRRRAGLLPNNDVVSNLVYSGEGRDVRTVVVDGRVVVRDRRLVTMSEEHVLEDAERVGEEVMRRLKIRQRQRWPTR